MFHYENYPPLSFSIYNYLSDEAAINLNNYGQNRLSAYQSADDFIMFTNPKSMNFKSTIKINSLFTTQYFRFLNIGHNGRGYGQSGFTRRVPIPRDKGTRREILLKCPRNPALAMSRCYGQLFLLFLNLFGILCTVNTTSLEIMPLIN